MANQTNEARLSPSDEPLVVYPIAQSRIDDLVQIDDDLGLEPGTSFEAAVDMLKGFLELRQQGYKIVAERPEGPTRELHIDL